MSKIRDHIPVSTGDLPPEEGDMKIWEVFTQLSPEKGPVYAGTINAADAQMALTFGREHYGRDQPCVAVWVVPRDAITKTDMDKDVVWRLSDQSYRLARGYTGVRKKWEKFRSKEAIDKYAKEDLREVF